MGYPMGWLMADAVFPVEVLQCVPEPCGIERVRYGFIHPGDFNFPMAVCVFECDESRLAWQVMYCVDINPHGFLTFIWYTQGFLIRPAVVQHQMIVPAGERHAFSGAIVGIQFKLHRINSAKPVAPLLLLAHGVHRRAEQCRTEKECGGYLQHRESLLLFYKRKMALC